jgi:hypothetical protein
MAENQQGLIEEIISKLPDAYKGWARRYAAILVDMGFEEIDKWVDSVINLNWADAYRSLAVRMTTEQLLTAQEQVNQALRELNKQAVDFIQIQKQMVREALSIAIMILKALLIGGNPDGTQ